MLGSPRLTGRSSLRIVMVLCAAFAATTSAPSRNAGQPWPYGSSDTLLMTIDTRSRVGQCPGSAVVDPASVDAVWLTRRRGPPEALILL